jgi:hypothetical protein
MRNSLLATNRQLICWGAVLVFVTGSSCLLIARGDDPPRENAPTGASLFEIKSIGEDTILLDRSNGNTWALRCLKDGTPSWSFFRPVPQEKGPIDLKQKDDGASAKVDRKILRSSLANMLETLGYTRIRLQPTAGGFFTLKIRVKAVAFNMVLDTGANASHLDRRRTSGAGIFWAEDVTDLVALKSSKAKPITFVDQIEIEGFRSGKLVLGEFDMSKFNELFAAEHEPLADGLLGADILHAFSAIIDYPSNSLFLLDRKSQASEKKAGN